MKNIRNRNIFVDANVIIDYLLNRKYHTENARFLFDFAREFSVTLYICSYSFAIAYYYLRDANVSHDIALETLEKMFQEVKCIPVDDTVIRQALKSGFGDFEDAIQYCCALQIPECKAIITRNPKDFALSNVPVTTPRTFIFHQFKN